MDSSRIGLRFTLPMFPILTVTLAALGQELTADRFEAMREKMVQEQVIRDGVRDPRVIGAMRKVPRHLFVREELQTKAYEDQILSIGHNQTLSTASIVSFMTEMIEPRPEDRVLEIGTGSGYQAAVLSGLVKDVYTIEIVDPLAKEAAARLKKLGFKNVHVRSGDGYKGWPEAAPFDKVIVTCSPEKVPQPLVDQLKEGGKIIIPLGERFSQAFYLLEKVQGKMVQTRLQPTLFVPMTGQAEKARERMVNGAQPRIVNGGFEDITEGMPVGWFYQRQITVESFGAREGKHFLRFTNTEPKRASHVIQAMAVDGGKIRNLRISCMVSYTNTAPGTERFELPALVVQFYDSNYKEVGEAYLGPWIGSSNWRRVVGDFRVPPTAQSSMIRLGLNGATGVLNVDDISLTFNKR